jgi:2-oxoglutarate dehydrogenase E2 component (dihydrolipoamide succinyltransferase)
MLIDVILPQLGESVAEGTISKWLVRAGELVQKDQPIVSVATDKADADVPAPVGGRLVEILAAQGATLAVNTAIARIEDSEPAAVAEGGSVAEQELARGAAEPDESAALRSDPGLEGATVVPGALATPAVRKAALEHDVRLADVRGTGEHGRVTREDVLRAARSPDAGSLVSTESAGPRVGREQLSPTEHGPAREAEAGRPVALASPPSSSASDSRASDASRSLPPSAPPARAMSGPAPVVGVGYGSFRVTDYKPASGDQVVAMTRRRRITADHMVYSKAVSPHVVAVAEVDLKRASGLRELHKARYKAEGMNLTMLAFVVVATARALREHPAMNARMLDDAYVLLRQVHIGVAVDSSDGLVVPVVRHADELGVRGVVRAIDDVAMRAKAGKITLDDLGGATFSVSNPGLKGNLFGGAIINQPNVGILRMGEIQKRVVVVESPEGEDQLAIHPVMYLALSYDHRVVDGVAANGFLWRVTELLERADFEP